MGKGNITDQREFSPTDGVRRTLRRVVKQIDNANDLTELGYKILLESGYLNSNASDRGKAKDKFVIKSSAPIHHIRFNHVVGVKRKNGNNSKISGVTNNDLNVELIVQQVKWNYPSGVTTINVGEYDIDFFDDIIKVGKSTDNLTDTTL